MNRKTLNVQRPTLNVQNGKRWAGQCGCGKLGVKVGGIVSCDDCLRRDERSGYGVPKVSGVRVHRRRGELFEEALC